MRPAAVRLAMAHAAFDGLALVVVSDREIRRAGPSYTIDTVRELLDEAERGGPHRGGRPRGVSSTRWHEADDTARSGRRRRRAAPGLGERGAARVGAATRSPMEPVDLSSTFIRELDPRVRRSRDVPAGERHSALRRGPRLESRQWRFDSST